MENVIEVIEREEADLLKNEAMNIYSDFVKSFCKVVNLGNSKEDERKLLEIIIQLLKEHKDSSKNLDYELRVKRDGFIEASGFIERNIEYRVEERIKELDSIKKENYKEKYEEQCKKMIELQKENSSLKYKVPVIETKNQKYTWFGNILHFLKLK